jgi:hypothetical protein
MGYLGNQITTVFPTSISVDSATISGNASVGGTLGVTGVSTLSDNIVFDASGKGVHLGVTSATASNLLDDFEEGTWTPTASTGLAYDFQYGYYIKMGKLVFISFDIDTSSVSASGAQIYGLPFTSAASSLPPFGIANIGYYSGITTGVHWLSGYVQAGNNRIYFTGNSGSNTTIQHNTFNVFNDNTRILGSMTYVAA